jgi:uncharacterized protein YjbI with pentapeptide repeats
LEDEESDAYHFEGFFFPSSVDFSTFKFKKDVFFCETEFSGKNTDFQDAIFSGRDTFFCWAIFLGEEVDFSGATFSGKYTDFREAKFIGGNSKNRFLRVEFFGEATNFSSAEFSGQLANFTLAKFLAKSTYFWKAKFSAEATHFDSAEFSGEEVNFYYSEFFKKILFGRTIFKAKANFTAVDLRKCIFRELDLRNVDFSLLEWNWKYRLGNETGLEKTLEELNEKKQKFYFFTSEIYRQLKVQFHTKRDFAKAGMFHFREQECKRKACKLPQEFFRWIFLWILRLSCGYGEKLGNVGLSSVALVFIFGIIYMFLGLHNTDQNESLLFQYSFQTSTTTSLGAILKDFWTSLVFSVKGFFPLWRFQQYKVVRDFANLVAGIEFLLGAFMVGLFVYVFRRRMDK